MPGPLQVIAVSFGPGADFEGRVLAEVDRLQGRGVLRLLDVLFVAKSDDGVVERLVVGDDDDFGALLASVVPFEGAGLVGEGFLTPETGLLVGAEVAAMEEAARVIAAAQAAEADTMLLAMAAQARAVEAIATSDAIRAAAAADTIRALITAGIVEEAAAVEAVEALTAAGIIVAAADEAATEAVAEAAATVKAASITMAQARVLRYLPTRLSFAVIANKLGISRAAAKERAERVYKKLGVHSRSEAVTRARALGIID